MEPEIYLAMQSAMTPAEAITLAVAALGANVWLWWGASR